MAQIKIGQSYESRDGEEVVTITGSSNKDGAQMRYVGDNGETYTSLGAISSDGITASMRDLKRKVEL